MPKHLKLQHYLFRLAGRCDRTILLASLAVCHALPVSAQISDTIHPYVLASINHDDNLLRRSDTEAGQFGDTYKSTEAGLLFERPFGRQVLTGRANVSKVSFDGFKQLNYTGKNLEATLEWHLGNYWQGHLGSTYGQTLAPYADFNTQERNLRVIRHDFFDASWLVHPSWQLRSAWSRDRYIYDLPSQRYNNRTEDVAELGVDFLASSTSRFGVVARQLKGNYTDRHGFNSVLFDSGYVQEEIKANVLWYLSGSSRLQFLGGGVRRKHTILTVRDEQGANGRAIFYWRPTVKLNTTSKLWREFSAVEGSLVNSALNRGASLDLSYEVSAKISMAAATKLERRQFGTLPGVQSLNGNLEDSTRSASIGVNYALLPNIKLAVNATRDSRVGSRAAGTNSFKANGISFNASAQF